MWVFLPASVLVFVSGVGLVESGFWDWDETFIVAGIVLWAVYRSSLSAFSAARWRGQAPGSRAKGRALSSC